MTMKELWVYVYSTGIEIDRLSESLLAKAREISKGHSIRLCALIIGGDSGAAAEALAQAGIERVYLVESDLPRENHLARAGIVAGLAAEKKPSMLLLPSVNSAGIVAATLGVRLNTGVIAHCVDVRINEEELLVGTVPAYGGLMLGDILCPGHEPQIATVKPDNCRLEPNGTTGEILTIPGPDTGSAGVALLDILPGDDSGPPLELAEVIVCAGAGVRSRECWDMLSELAGYLGAAVACTRPVLEEGWGISEKQMIGTSGVSVAPKLYIGFGVSGSTHHVCGMKESGIIINLNRDEKTPIFNSSDYGLVGDISEILPLVLKRLREARQDA